MGAPKRTRLSIGKEDVIERFAAQFEGKLNPEQNIDQPRETIETLRVRIADQINTDQSLSNKKDELKAKIDQTMRNQGKTRQQILEDFEIPYEI